MKKVLSFLVVLSLVFSCLPATAFAASEPFEIRSRFDMEDFIEEVKTDPSIDAVLTADIDAEGTSLGDIAEYTGVFDGQGYTIYGLTDSHGLFEKNSGTVKNLRLSNVNILGAGDNVGAVAGINAGTIQNCVTSGSVTGPGYSVGGIVGHNLDNALVKDCISYCTVDGKTAGALVGSNFEFGRMENCVFLGTKPYPVEGDNPWGTADHIFYLREGQYFRYGDDVVHTAAEIAQYFNSKTNASGYKFTLAVEDDVLVVSPGDVHGHCRCGTTHTGNSHPLQERLFKPITTAQELLDAAKTSGHYYLATDINTDVSITVAEYCAMFLCLNGKALTYTGTASDTPILSVSKNATLILADCGTNTRPGYIDASAQMWVPGTATEQEDTVLPLTGGLITGGGNSNYGCVHNEGTFHMYGGNLAGNSSFGMRNQKDFYLYGGTITGNLYTGLENGAEAYCEIRGGKICYNAHTGVLSSSNKDLIMSGGEISHNGHHGVYTSGGSALIMSGGTITGNLAGVYCNLIVSGNPVITGNKDANVSINESSIILIQGSLTSGANIGVTLQESKVGTFAATKLSTINMQECAQYFSSDEGFPIVCNGDSLWLGYVITGQPIYPNYSVSVNSTEGASYQWYKADEILVPITDQDVEDFKDNYNSSTGLWSAETSGGGSHRYCRIHLTAGDKLVAEFSSSVNGSVLAVDELANKVRYFAQDGNTYTFTAQEDGDYLVAIQQNDPGDDASVDSSPMPLSLGAPGDVKLSKANYTNLQPLSGQTSRVLNLIGLQSGNYLCRITWNLGTPNDTSDDYSLDSWVITHSHVCDYTYSASGSIITETCTCGHRETATLAAPTGPHVYDGEIHIGASVSYSSNWQGGRLTLGYENNINAGTAYAMVTKDGQTALVSFTIDRAVPGVTAPVGKQDLVYNGSGQELVSSGFASGGNLQYALGTATQATGAYSTQIPEGTDAGTYYVWYKVTAENTNYTDVDPVCIPVTIDRRELSAMNVTLSNTEFTYNAVEQTPTVVVSYNGNPLTKDTDYTIDWAGDKTSAGTQTLRVRFLGNYTGTAQASYQIKRRAISINWGPKEFMPYTGQQIIPQVTAGGLVGSDTCNLTTTVVETTPGAGIIPGRWHATISALSNANYCLPGNENLVTVEYGITNGFQEQPVVSGVNETIAGKADGKISGLTTAMEYATEYTADDDKYTKVTDENMTFAPGTYYVRYQAKQYYNPSAFTTVTIGAGRKLTVTLPQNQVGYTLTADKTEFSYKDDVTFTLNIAPGYSKTSDFAVKLNGVPMPWGDESQMEVQSCTEDLVISVEGVADVTAPTVELSVAGNKWTSLLNTITFGLFFKETQDVTIHAADSGSGIRSIRYHLSLDQMDLGQLLAITNWTDYNGTFQIAPNNRYIIYVEVLDHTGNSTYVSSDGLVLDNIAPTLEGIEDGRTYYGDLTVIKPESQFADIKQVTLDGEPMGFAEGTYGLVRADNAQHTVVAEDHAGNKTTYTVTVMKLYTVTFMVDGQVYDTQTIPHGDAAAIPQPPAKAGYDQKEPQWDHNGLNITEDTTITLTYFPNVYTVTLKADGKTVTTLSVEHGKTPNLPAPPAKDGYTAAWDKTAAPVTDDVTYIAVYTALPEPPEGDKPEAEPPEDEKPQEKPEEEKPQQKPEEEKPQEKPEDEKPQEKPEVEQPDKEQPAKKEHTVTLIVDGKELQVLTVEHGKTPKLPTPPAKDGFTASWDKKVSAVTGDVTYTVVYTPIAETPQTGDPIQLGILLLVMLLSGTTLAALLIGKKRRLF